METLQDTVQPEILTDEVLQDEVSPPVDIKKKLRNDILFGAGFIVVFLAAFGTRKENWVGYLFLICLAFITVAIVLRHMIRKEVFKKENLPKTLGTVAVICGILAINAIGIKTILSLAFQLILLLVLLAVAFYIGQKMGFSKKKIVIACLVVAPFVFFFGDGVGSGKVRQSPFDNSVDCVEYYLKHKYLRDPDSYQGVTWSKVQKNNDGTYRVTHTFRARNGFGGMGQETLTFRIASDGWTILGAY